MEVKELITKSQTVLKEIEDYIKSVPDWIYYWIPPTLKTDSKSYPLKEFILEFQDDWEDEVTLKVNYFDGVSVKVEITVPIDGEEVIFERYLILEHFERNVENNKKAMIGQLNDIKIKELNKEIAYHKEQLRIAEIELNKLIGDETRRIAEIGLNKLIGDGIKQ